MRNGTRNLLKRLEVSQGNQNDDHDHPLDNNDETSNTDIFLTNHDLLPIPPQNRIWGKWTYFLFWFGECASVTSWTVASAGVKSGLSWWEAWLCVILGHLIVAFPLVAVGRAGAVYHLGFPTITRASFGVMGSLWPIINRDVMTVVWTGVQGVTAGNSIYVMLHALFPSIAGVPNPFSGNSDVTMTGGKLIGFSVGWLVTLGLAFVRTHKFRGLIAVKSAIMISCLVAFFAWTVVEAHGVGPVVRQGSSIPAGESHAWVFLTQLFIQAANMATFATNNADLSRYARRPGDTLWTQLLGMPIAYGVIGFFGIFITSASGVILGEVQWDPNEILDSYLLTSSGDYNYSSPGRRAAVFFLAAGFSFAQVTTQVFANLIAAGNDTAALLPRYVDMRRGAIICLVLAFAITPWNLLRSSFTFTTYLGSYQIFLSAIIGVLLADYYYVRRGYINVPALFMRGGGGVSGRNDVNPYWYHGGWNWRAYVGYIAGIIPCLPGFLDNCGVPGIPLGAQRLYVFALPVGIVVSGAAYVVCCHVSPPPGGGLAHGWREDIDGLDANGRRGEGLDVLEGMAAGNKDGVKKAKSEVDVASV